MEIPREDYEPGDENRVAKLRMSLYGTGDAAQNWAVAYTRMLEGIGFVAGKASPCNFQHASRNIALTVHGDDFVITGEADQLKWLGDRMREKYDVNTVTFYGAEEEFKVNQNTPGVHEAIIDIQEAMEPLTSKMGDYFKSMTDDEWVNDYNTAINDMLEALNLVLKGRFNKNKVDAKISHHSRILEMVLRNCHFL